MLRAAAAAAERRVTRGVETMLRREVLVGSIYIMSGCRRVSYSAGMVAVSEEKLRWDAVWVLERKSWFMDLLRLCIC